MFWTAFVWGFGASCGAAIGLVGFLAMLWTLEWFFGRTEAKINAAKNAAESLLALQRRNELTEEQVKHLAVLSAAAVEYMDGRR